MVKNKLTRIRKEILSATNEPLNVFGKTEMSIKIGQKIYHQELAVAKIAMDGVLGLNFLNKNKYKLEIGNRKLLIGADEIPRISEGSIGCYRISISETCSIPPRSEIVVFGNVNLAVKDHIPDGLSLIEPEESFTKTGVW